MLKREIKYEDFNGNEVTEAFYFNISKPELIELEVEYNQGFATFIQGVIDAQDNRTLVREFKRIVLLAYGVKSDDGKRFIKTDKIREEFEQTAAYQELFMELATKDEAAVTFLRGVLPRDMVGELVMPAQIPSGSTPSAPAPSPPSPPTPPQTS